MKKIYIIGLMALLVAGTVWGTLSFGTKEEAQTQWTIKNAERDTEVNKIMNTITYNDIPKTCWLNSQNGQPMLCEVEVPFTYTQGKSVISSSVMVFFNHGASNEEDKKLIETAIKEKIKQNNPIEEIKYIEKIIPGGSIVVG